ncbi:hypothetical protein RhiXN_07711 [Rhizoctonia solani]|uniref:Transmembrane protein n=1 Tax=Rhizoctonia solani TaxID=456999 RepID=A0A8H8NZZ1_9AGAM|nr:uncharacterized protein RhiXN_07711 [Rhizoctonia solani]QRW22675.1 hypothetical protein RhiXN_07711 [Rhizoctonia solani]
MSTTRQRQTGKTEAEKNPENLPPKRESKTTQDVRAPLSGTSLSTVIYSLAALGLIWGALSAYRIVQLKADAGGWYNLALGRRPDTGAPVKGNPHHIRLPPTIPELRALKIGYEPSPMNWVSIRVNGFCNPPTYAYRKCEQYFCGSECNAYGRRCDRCIGSDNPSGEQQANGASSGFPDLGTLVGLDDPAPGLDG